MWRLLCLLLTRIPGLTVLWELPLLQYGVRLLRLLAACLSQIAGEI